MPDPLIQTSTSICDTSNKNGQLVRVKQCLAEGLSGFSFVHGLFVCSLSHIISKPINENAWHSIQRAKLTIFLNKGCMYQDN